MNKCIVRTLHVAAGKMEKLHAGITAARDDSVPKELEIKVPVTIVQQPVPCGAYRLTCADKINNKQNVRSD